MSKEEGPKLFYKGDWELNSENEIPSEVIRATINHVSVMEASMIAQSLINPEVCDNEEIKGVITPYLDGLKKVGIDPNSQINENVLRLLRKNIRTYSGL